MKPYSKLRGRMSELDISSGDLANYLGKSPSYVSYRLTNRYGWEINEIYQILDYLKLPHEAIFAYFPPNAGMPQKAKKLTLQRYTIKRQVCGNG